MFTLGTTLPAIEAPRLVLRWLTADDARDLFAIFGDAAVMRYWSRPAYENIAGAEQLVREIHSCFAERSLFQWGVERREDRRVIGTCTLAKLDFDNRRAELGYALGREHWGKGLATEAVGAVLDFAFDGLGLGRIEADVDPRNTRSIAMLERMGFEREGYCRERWRVGGEVQDSVLFGLLARDWRARER